MPLRISLADDEPNARNNRPSHTTMKPPSFKPKWNDPCLCGSGKKHRDCCWQKLPGLSIGKEYLSAIRERQYERALRACRADIVQYTIWHKSHTEPLLLHGQPIDDLLSIDVNALADYVERLFWLYLRNRPISDWLPVLERLRTNIRHPSWEKKIGYFRALSWLAPDGNRHNARQELSRIGPITPAENDVDVLQIYVDLESDSEPLATRLKLFDRILELSKARGDQLQYRGAKALQYFLVGDTVTAECEFAEAIALVSEADPQDPLSDHERILLSRLLQMLAWLRNDRDLLREALKHLNDLLKGDNWTNSGRAALYREIGDCYKYANDWSAAEQAYRDALDHLDNPADRIQLAEALLYQKEIERAADEIAKVDTSTLGQHEHEDYVFARAAIAIWLGRKSALQEAKTLLEGLKTNEPYFNERRLTLLLAIARALTEGMVSESDKAESTPEGGVASATSSFLILQPNFMGIGININAIIDYFLNRRKG